MRTLSLFLAGLAVPFGAAVAGAQSPAPQPAAPATGLHAGVSNQSLATDVAQLLKNSGVLHDYSLDLVTDNGVVTLRGHVADQSQKNAALALVRRYPGVTAVRDELNVVKTDDVRMAQYVDGTPAKLPAASTDQPGPVVPGPMAGPGQEPAPTTAFTGGLTPFSHKPVLPPYSWPAYTPYNNYASMAYQTQYPSGAWPFIGPPHPYPMIPSGWRRVTLKWKKGYWWLKFHAH